MSPTALSEVAPLPVEATPVKSKAPSIVRPAYEIREEPIHSRRPLRIACLGAGYSGMLMGIIFDQRMQNRNVDLVIYERNAALGGTWLENRYPGIIQKSCKCDIPAHNYSYSFEPNPEWPNYYATSAQILDCMKKTAKKYDVERFIKYEHSIKHAQWDEGTGKWRLKVESRGNVFDDVCDIFINAGGVLNNWKWPNVEGLGEFKGRLVHSANWDESIDFTGKKVAVIGVGSSAIQIIPKLAKVASHLTSFIRSHVWVSPAPGINEPTDNDPDMDDQYNYAPHVVEKFKSDPNFCQEHRQALIDRRIVNFKRSIRESDVQKNARELFIQKMKERLGDSEKGKNLAKMLIPPFPVGCRRQTPGPGYLEALIQDNVDARWDDIGVFTEKEIRTKSGEELEFDIIVCATGFDTTFRPRFPIVGRNGVDLAKRWTDDLPLAYFGITIPDFPNYFSFIGPGSPISNGSLVVGIQAMGIYIYKCIDKIQTECIRSMAVTHEATMDYNEHIQRFLQRTVWVADCRSWYKRGTADGPHGIDPYEGFESICVSLGNGFTLREAKAGKVSDIQTINFDEYWNLLVLPELYD
ncbi:hypothetical protein B7463_g7837, partial [Scytalidium lignicola]